jgi:hypothetical protein
VFSFEGSSMKLDWNRMIAGAALLLGGLLWTVNLGPKASGPMTWQHSQYTAGGSLAMSVGFGLMYATWRHRGAGPGRRH